MESFLPPYHAETRPLILPILLDTFGPNATLPTLPIPPPPSGDVLRATIYEYGLQYGPDGSTDFSSCHDLQLGTDGVVYNDSGIQWIDPRTGEHGVFPMNGGGHSHPARPRRQHVDHPAGPRHAHQARRPHRRLHLLPAAEDRRRPGLLPAHAALRRRRARSGSR